MGSGFFCGDGSASTGDKQMISFGAQDREKTFRKLKISLTIF